VRNRGRLKEEKKQLITLTTNLIMVLMKMDQLGFKSTLKKILNPFKEI